MKRLLILLVITSFFLSCEYIPFLTGKSIYPTQINDPNAVYLTPDNFNLNVDGKTDNSAAIQSAIDYVEKYNGFGIVFIPSGKYAIKNTINVWRGIRLIGYGRKRPEFILPENTVELQSPKQYMIHFRDRKPVLGEALPDARNTTFYSGMSNIDITIEKYNSNAVAIRFNAAQLSTLEAMDFDLKSGYSALEQAGNQIVNCNFSGGGYAITADHSASGSPTLLMNCSFDNQNHSAIISSEAGISIVGCSFENMTHAVIVKENSNEKLVIQDSWCNNISMSAIFASRYNSPENYIIMDNFQCSNTPNLLLFRDRNTPVSINAQYYQVNELTHGLLIDRQVAGKYNKTIRTKYGYNVLPDLDDPVISNCPTLPFPKSWFNVKDYGAMGDGRTDDTIAIRKAIRDHKTIYFPSGYYVISESIVLRKNTKLIGLHPKATQFVVLDNTLVFNQPDSLKPMIIAPENGRNMISGLGFNPGLNTGIVQLKWMAGKNSYLNDAWFEWGGQGDLQVGKEFPYSLWITNNGGGFLKNVWCANLLANSSVLIQNTETPGNVFLLCTENNYRNIVLQNVKNWSFNALLCEENVGQQDALMIDLQQSRGINFSNLFVHREISSRKTHNFSLLLQNNSSAIIKGMHNASWGNDKFDHSVYHSGSQLYIAEKDFSYSRIPSP